MPVMRVAVVSLLIILSAAIALAQPEPDYCTWGSGSYIGTWISETQIIANALYSDATAEFEGCTELGFQSQRNYSMTVLHRMSSSTFVMQGLPVVVASYGAYLSWSGRITTGGVPGACYRAYVDAKESLTGLDQGSGSGEKCLPKTNSCSDESCDTGDFTNWSDPIVIALGDSAYRFTGPDAGVHFDLDNDHVAELTAWTRADDDVAFLALDRNGDGMINDATELFGDHMNSANNGFLALAKFDANGDGVVDSRDPVWSSLLLWTDRNHDGVSQSHELTRIADSAVLSIDLGYHYTGRRDASGNLFVNAGHAQFASGTRPIYDVWLTRINLSTQQ